MVVIFRYLSLHSNKCRVVIVLPVKYAAAVPDFRIKGGGGGGGVGGGKYRMGRRTLRPICHAPL